MKPTPFNPETDLATTPFDRRHCDLAAELKQAGLPWNPHVGCFVWDCDAHIEAPSPFPGRIYFILNSGHFLKRFETLENLSRKLVWLPTWHQARLLCRDYGIKQAELLSIWSAEMAPGEELIAMYELIKTKLHNPHL